MAEKSSGGAKPIHISDVAKPGKSAPSASSKPIIVTNRPVLRDPMMAAEDSGEKESGAASLPMSHLKIGPLSEETKAQTDSTDDKPGDGSKPEKETDETTEPKPEPAGDDESKADAQSEDKPEPVTDSHEEATPKTDDSAAPEAAGKEANLTVDDDAAADSKPDPTDPHAEADQAAADLRAKELEDLAESRKYYLPVNHVEKRRNRRSALIGTLLILLLAVAWADISLDAGIISLPGIKPLTHFFSN